MHRNTATSSNEYFLKLTQLKAGESNQPPKLDKQIHGAALGAPVKKNRLFFYANYEQLKESSESPVIRNVPSETLRDGILVYQCAVAAACAGGTVRGLTGASHQIQAGYYGLSPAELAAIDPLGLGPSRALVQYWQQYPTPNDPGTDGLNVMAYRFAAPVENNFKTFVGRAAMKYLVPLARANRAACLTLADAIARAQLSTREVGDLYALWQEGTEDMRALLGTDPLLMLRVRAHATGRPDRGAAPRLLDDVTALAGLARRAHRRLREGVATPLAAAGRHEAIARWLRRRRIPAVYQLHHRIVDTAGYVHVDRTSYSVPVALIGRRVEIRDAKTTIEIFQGPRLVAAHAKVLDRVNGYVTDPAHRPRRGEPRLPRTPLPDEVTLLRLAPELTAYVAAIKRHAAGRVPRVLRRLLGMVRDYPRAPLLAAVQAAADYGLYDLDRVERMVLQRIAHDYFVVAPPREDDDDR